MHFFETKIIKFKELTVFLKLLPKIFKSISLPLSFPVYVYVVQKMNSPTEYYIWQDIYFFTLEYRWTSLKSWNLSLYVSLSL